nr:MAG TPA: minor tail protein [Caudoviricetes sp.]
MADVDITSLSVEISAESQGAELNIDKLTTAISNLRTKGSVGKVCSSLDKLSSSIAALKQAYAGISGLDKVTNFLNGISSVNTTAGVKGVNSVVNAIKKIPSAVSEANKADYTQLAESCRLLMNGIAPLSVLDFSNLKNFGSVLNSLNKVPDLAQKLDSKTVSDFSTACQKLYDGIAPLASQLETVGNAFAKLPPQLSKVVTQANRVTAANERQKKSYMSLSSQMNSFMRNMAKLVSLKAIADYLGNAVAKFNDFYEAANMFGVSMGDMTNEASGFIDKMEQLLGIDPSEAMNAMANIYSMTKSFGLAKEQAYTLSKSLTQLGYDLSSLKNIPISQAFTKIRSAMAGELEPMLQLGIDISQARLQQELLALGFNKQVSTLSQADKATLRYIAILKQTTDAQGDFARTLSSPSNMIRVLKAQLSGLARDIGSLLYPALKSILPPLIAAVELIREFVQWVAKLMGVKVEFPDVSSASDAVNGVTDALDNTTKATGKAAKAFKNYIMGFDELNVIQKNADSSGGSGSGSGATGNLLGDVDLSGYDMFKQYNEEFAKQIDSLKKKIKDMLPAIGAVTAALALWKIVDFLTDVSTAIAKMTELQKLALSIATVVIEATLVFNFAKGYASNGNPLELLGEIVTAALGSFVLWRTIGADGITLGMGVAFVASLAGLTYALKTGSAKIDSPSTWIQGVLSTAFGSITGITLLTNLGFGGAAAAAVSISLAAIVTLAGITYGATKSGQLLEGSFTDKLLKTVMGVIGAALGAGAALLLGASLPVTGFAAGIGMTLAVIINKVAVKFGKSGNSVDAMSGADAGINKIDAWFQEKVAGLKENWEKSLSSLGEAFSILRLNLDQASADLNDWFVDVGVWWDEKWKGFSTNFQKSWDSLPNYVRHPIKSLNEASNDLNDWFVGVGVWWDEKWKGFKTNWDKAWNSLVDTLKELPQKFLDYGKNIVQGLIDGINKGIESAKKSVSGLAKAILDKFTTDTGIHSPSKVFKGYGVYLIEGLVNGISAAKDLAVKTIQSVSDAVKTVGSQLADENYGLGNGSISLSIDASGKSMMETANALKRSVRTTNDSFGGWFKKMKTDLNDFTEGIDAVTKAGKDISNGFKSSIDALTAASKSILNTHDGFVSAVSDIRSFVKKSVAEIENEYQYNGFFGAAGLAIQKAFEGVYLVFDKVSTAVKNVSDTIDSVKNVITTFNNLKTKVGEIIDQVPALKQAYGGLKSFFSDLFNKDSGIGKIVSDGFDFIKTKAGDVANWFKEKLNIGSSGSSAGGGSLGALGSTAASGGALSNLGAYGGIGVGVGLGAAGGMQWWKDMIGTWSDSNKSTGTKLLETAKHTLWDLSPIGALVNLGKSIFGFADGGFPDAGQLFIAREAGAEMVGSMGGHTAVANNDQIVEGIREGVEAAMERQNQLLRQQNELLQALLEKEGSAEINVSSFYQAVNRTNQRNGKTIIPVGT